MEAQPCRTDGSISPRLFNNYCKIISCLRKYFNLKNNGKLIKNANYKIIYQNGKNYLKVFYKDNNLDYELTGKLTFKSKEKSGKTDILVNKKDPNEFYAFGPLK